MPARKVGADRVEVVIVGHLVEPHELFAEPDRGVSLEDDGDAAEAEQRRGGDPDLVWHSEDPSELLVLEVHLSQNTISVLRPEQPF